MEKYMPVVSTFDDLRRELHSVFSEDKVNVEYVHELMSAYKSNPIEWRRYAKFDRFRYTRNLVDEGNGKFNLMILCWGEGHGSSIHDHADAHCFMKVLHGGLSEVRFEWPSDSEENQELREICRTQLNTNGVCYINDSIGLHRVENVSNVDKAVSLHLYCPPFDSCNIFNQQTGRKTKTNVTFWSKYGEKRSKEVRSSCDPEDN